MEKIRENKILQMKIGGKLSDILNNYVSLKLKLRHLAIT